MKAGVKKAVSIIAALICVILFATVILGIIKIRPLNSIGEYDKVSVIYSYNLNQKDDPETIEKALKSAKFSVLRSIQKSGFKSNIKPVYTTKKNSDGEEEKINAFIKATDFENLTTKNGEFMLRLEFLDENGKPRLMTNKRFTTIDGEKIRYDTVIVVIPPSSKNISEIKLYPYIDGNISNSLTGDAFDDDWRIGSDFYKIYEFKSLLYTKNLYSILSEEFEFGEYQNHEDNGSETE